MFNLPFTSTQGESQQEGDEKKAEKKTEKKMGGKTTKRSRRRRNMKSRKAQVEPVGASDQKNKGKKQHDAPMTKGDLYFALDCEMVGTGPDGFDSAVARVTVVNWENVVVLDTFVKVPVPVTDYRSHISGIRPEDIESDSAMSFEEARTAVGNILRGKILIGHGLECDLCALGLTHPYCDVRDTARYVPFMREAADYETGKPVWQARKLRDLSWEKLSRQIQVDGEPHSPLEDAVAALDLYKLCRKEWEEQLSMEQMKQIREAENQRRVKSMFFPGGFSPPPGSSVGMYNPNAPMGYAYGGPFGPAVPGFAPAPPGVELSETPLEQQEPKEDGDTQQQQSSTSWRWYPSLRRPKSPSQDVIPEEECPSSQDPVSPKSSGFFFLRRQRSVRLQHSGSAETDNTTVCTDTESNHDLASEAESNFSPDYSYLQETNWSQSFQVVGDEANKDQMHFDQLFDPAPANQQHQQLFYEQDQQYFYEEDYSASSWYNGNNEARSRFMSI